METIELLRKAHNGDKEARDLLVSDNVGLIWSVVKRFNGRGHDMEDLFQIGCIGMMKAIDKFDFSYDVKFSTYAVPMISGEIKRFLRDDGMIKVSRSIKENGWKIIRAGEAFVNEMGRDATIEELAAATELTVEEVVMALDAGADVESIYKSVYQNDGNEIYLVDRLVKEKDENEEIINHLMLNEMLDNLSERDRQLIVLRYFQDKTQMDVAEIMGISQVQVSRMEKKILLRLRSNLE